MQKTRQKIISFLKEHGSATVDELSEALDNLTAVTVRHHLDVLRGEGLVSQPEILHRETPGRPRYVYSLTEKAEALFPRNVNVLTSSILAELNSALGQQRVNVLLEGVAGRMASEFKPASPDEPLASRIERVVAHLTRHGYEASWEPHAEGYVLYAGNCPYEGVTQTHDELCHLDFVYISHLVGIPPRRLTTIREGDGVCSFLIPDMKGLAAG